MVAFTPLEEKILHKLALAGGRTVTEHQLHSNSQSLKVTISRLRKRLGIEIIAVWEKGYLIRPENCQQVVNMLEKDETTPIGSKLIELEARVSQLEYLVRELAGTDYDLLARSAKI